MNDDALLEVSPPQAQGFTPLGEVFSAARKAKKLSEQDVSNNLRISPKQISDIENNNFSMLPQSMITRGFIRNYARLLELDAEPLLDSYRARMPDKTPKSLAVQSSMNQVVSGKENQPWLKYILGSILIMLLLLAWIFYIDYMPKLVKIPPEKAPESRTAAPPATELVLPEIALPAAERQNESSDVTGINSGTTTSIITLPAENTTNATSPAASTTAANAFTTSAPAIETAKLANATSTSAAPKTSTAIDFNTLKEKAGQSVTNANKPATVVANPATNSVATPAQKVSLTIAEKTWVQATDRSGKVVYERILPAGSTDGFDGQPPFNVIIGNAKATKLSFLGKPVDLASSTTLNNIARIKLE